MTKLTAEQTLELKSARKLISSVIKNMHFTVNDELTGNPKTLGHTLTEAINKIENVIDDTL